MIIDAPNTTEIDNDSEKKTIPEKTFNGNFKYLNGAI